MFASLSQFDKTTKDFISNSTEKFIALSPGIFSNSAEVIKQNQAFFDQKKPLFVEAHKNNCTEITFSPDCSKNVPEEEWCENFSQSKIINDIFQISIPNLRKEYVPINGIHHWPSGSSIKTWEHLFQWMQTPLVMPAFDYGEERNIKEYNQKTPPTYDYEDISVPTVIVFGGKEPPVAIISAKAFANRMKKFNMNTFHVLQDYEHGSYLLYPDEKIYKILEDNLNVKL